jgi:hypothetical protein
VDAAAVERRRIAKGRVIDELVQTEMDYYRVMRLLHEVYVSPPCAHVDAAQKRALFCNVRELADVSAALLAELEARVLGRRADAWAVGECFLRQAAAVQRAYAHYAQHAECVRAPLARSAELRRFVERGLPLMRRHTAGAFDLPSLLLKPVQRVLKYPLLLRELLKNTEQASGDYEPLRQALAQMQRVAAYVNEIRRRRELVLKVNSKMKREKRALQAPYVDNN